MTTKYDVFLSHNSRDKAAVVALAEWLRDEMGLRVFLDAWELIPGEDWIEALEVAIKASATIAVFIGPSGIGGWHGREKKLALRAVALADEQERRVIPALLPGADQEEVTGFLGLRTWVDLAAGDGPTRLVAGIKGLAPSRVSVPSPIKLRERLRATYASVESTGAEPEPAPPSGSTERRLLAAHQRQERTAGNRASSSPIHPHSPRQWKAVPKLTTIFAAGPRTAVQALARAFELPEMTEAEGKRPDAHRARAKRVAGVIDQLGVGPSAAATLVEHCTAALLDVDDNHPDDSRAASSLVCDLVFEWLPRRCGDGTQLQQIDRSSIENACSDFLVQSAAPLATEIHVAGAENRKLGVKPSDKRTKIPYELPFQMALPPTLHSDIAGSEDIVASVADEIAAQLPVEFHEHATREHRRARAAAHLRASRRFRQGSYLVNEGAVLSDEEQTELKKIYRALRIVNLTGDTPKQESLVTEMLQHFVKRLQQT